MLLICILAPSLAAAAAGDTSLEDVLARGELRHLGIPYANFVTGDGTGLEPEVVRRFAEHLGVRYVFVPSDWATIIPDLVGREVVRDGDRASLGAPHPRRGDLIATGMTVLPWRQQVVAFSRPTFPTQIWLIAPVDSPLQPVRPTRDTAADIAATRALLDGLEVLTKENTCLDPRLYRLASTGARIVPFDDQLKFMAPATLNGLAEATILDVPDALVALHAYPGRIKVIGPISGQQTMAAAFRTDDEALRRTYDAFLARIRSDGTYDELVDRFYPAIHDYYPAFFAPEVSAP
ncbi:transporter substrate-binding domain-containing protein [bacterium]|nr:transporter substrate-binding domain-containing protein [bacterium]